MVKYRIVLAVVMFAVPTSAMSYVGPGAGVSLLSALFGLIVALAAAVGVLITWPLRILLRKIRSRSGVETKLTDYAAAAPVSGVDEKKP